MDRSGFTQLLTRADRETRPHLARMLVSQLRTHAGAPWVDAVLHERVRLLCARFGMTWRAVEASPLAIGEAWLLLAGRGGRGDAVRLCVGGEGDNLGAEAGAEARRALRGLLSTVAAQGRRMPSGATSRGLTIRGGAPQLEVVGSSLGLSAVIASLSAALGKPARSDVAGSATVDAEGRLGPVTHLPEKVRALRERWPEVGTLVVAAEQQDTETRDRAVHLARAPDLATACALFGLAVDDPLLPPCCFEERLRSLHALRAEDRAVHDSHRWLELSATAWEIARALDGASECSHEASEALLLAALFASHAGDNAQARDLLAGVPEEALGRHLSMHARKLIYQAAASIDEDAGDGNAGEAQRLALRAVALCAELPEAERTRVAGQAMGTLGRAHLHAGSPDAEAILRQALEHHRRHDRPEWPRSACYLATCLRRAGRSAEALDLLGQALLETERRAGWRFAETTGFYLRLERGRTLAGLGQLADAELDLASVVAAQDQAAAYPRLGAHRTLVEVLQRMGRQDEARAQLRTCVDLARGTGPATLRKVGAVAAGAALLSGDLLLPRRELEEAWSRCFPPEADRERTVRLWVY